MTKHGLGRIYQPDDRDNNYLLELATQRSSVPSKIWDLNVVLDQGQTPMCVGYSTAGWIVAAPVVNPLPDPVAVYHDAQLVDGSPLPHEGSTVRAAMKVLQSKGVVSQYNWAFDLTTVINYVLEKGPMVVGTNWYRSMFSVDTNYNIGISGKIAGGHAYIFIGADQNHKNKRGIGAFLIQSSWGKLWGNNGRAWLSFANVDRLLREQGEAAVATELQESVPVKF